MDKHYSTTRLNAENYFQLIKAEKDPDVLEYIENTVKNCCRYVEAVDMMETQLITARMRMEQDKYQEFIMNIDTNRRRLHNDAIASVNALNRIANANGIGNIFTGNNADRYEVADFCLDIVVAIFKNRK